MSEISLNIKLNDSNCKMPEYKTAGSSGMDVCSIESKLILPSMVAIISTGLSFEIPEGYEIQVRPRSGLAANNSITVLNTPGTIDSDYRGILKVILINLGTENFKIRLGDRIAQIVLCPVIKAKLNVIETIQETERGSGGFGSTGIK